MFKCTHGSTDIGTRPRYGNPVESPVCLVFFCLLGWGMGGGGE